jgi:hypothetical protein
LLNQWFYVDPKLADTKVLDKMSAELGPISYQAGSISKGLDAIVSLKARPVLPLLAAVVLLVLLYPGWPVIITLALFIGANFYLGIIGRPGILRVYYPLAALLVFAAVLNANNKLGKNYAIMILMLACIANVRYLHKAQEKSENIIRNVQQDMKKLPSGRLYIWGDSFPFEYAYPLLADNSDVNKLKFYSLGWNTPAPYSVSAYEEKSGHGFVKQLLQPGGMLIFAKAETQGKLLANYCAERLGGKLEQADFDKFESFTLLKVQCHTNIKNY